jgi:hypothetical protein
MDYGKNLYTRTGRKALTDPSFNRFKTFKIKKNKIGKNRSTL